MRRIPELDGMRGLAALTVVLFHLYLSVVPFGWAAVDLFFVLSGFLITGIILDQMDQPGFLKTFYARRSLRIWPIYYLAIFVVAIATACTWRCWLPFALYLQNTGFYLSPLTELRGKVFSPDWSAMNHAWSLAVEEQFYLLWPGILLLAGGRQVRSLALLALGVSITARWFGYPHTLLISRCDGLALGAILASLLHGAEASALANQRRVLRPWQATATTVLVLLMARLGWEWWNGAIRLPLGFRLEDATAEILTVSLLAFLAVDWVVTRSGDRRLAWLRWRPLRALGTISYGLYLYHVPVLHTVDAVIPRSLPGFRAIEGGLTLSLTIAIAALSWRWIEQPILKLKDRFDYRQVPGEPVSTEVSPAFAFSMAQK